MNPDTPRRPGRIFRFALADIHNDWATAIEVTAEDLAQAERRAAHWLFARRDVGVNVHLTPAAPAAESVPTLFGGAS
jgi:hypothetical protein